MIDELKNIAKNSGPTAAVAFFASMFAWVVVEAVAPEGFNSCVADSVLRHLSAQQDFWVMFFPIAGFIVMSIFAGYSRGKHDGILGERARVAALARRPRRDLAVRLRGVVQNIRRNSFQGVAELRASLTELHAFGEDFDGFPEIRDEITELDAACARTLIRLNRPQGDRTPDPDDLRRIGDSVSSINALTQWATEE